MNNEENKKKMVELDEGADIETNEAIAGKVGEIYGDKNDTTKKTDNIEMNDGAIASAISEITDATPLQSAQIVFGPDIITGSDKIFEDTMNTLKPVSTKLNCKKQATASIQPSSSEQHIPIDSQAPIEQVVMAEPINAEYLLDKNIINAKSMKTDKPYSEEIFGSKKITIKSMDIDIEESSAETLFKVPLILEKEFTGRSNFKYNNKVMKRRLKESIAELIKSIGQGQCGPVPYDTAWVARVPQIDDLSHPAFPLSLRWLRDHQLSDGSWGSAKPFSPHNSTLNTLATVIALAQWNNPEDKVRIENCIKTLWWLADLLPSEQYENVSFELIIFTLLNKASKYGLTIPYEHYESYKEKSNKKLELILSEFEKNGYSQPATWWHNLEILGDKIQINVDINELRLSLNMLTKDGLIGLSLAATAYILMSYRLKGIDIPEAQNYLLHLYSLYTGGIPTIFPIDILELAFTVDFLLESIFLAKHPSLQLAIRRLAESWNPKYGVGYSANWELFDANDTAVTLSILLKAGYKLSPEPILKFFNGTCIVTHIGETTPSISVNINALITLRLFNGIKEIDDVIQKILIWIDKCISNKQVFIQDNWNISPYYSTSRAVFASHGLRNDIVKRCLNFFIKNQSSDGSWGKGGFTTAEETAYVSLALCYGLKCGYLIPRTVLEAANTFLCNSHKLNMSPLWTDEVLYHPTLVARSAIISSQFALIKALELFKVKSILETIQPYYVVANVKTMNNEKNYDVFLLCSTPEFDISKYSKQVTRVREHILNRLVELNLIKKSKTFMKMLVPEVTLFMMRKELCDEDLILNSQYIASILVYDDILDKKYYQLNKNHTNIINQAFRTFLEILQGKYKSIDTIIPINFPKFISQCTFFFDMRHLLAKKQSDLSEFLSRNEKVFSYYIKDAVNVINGVCLSSHEYLEMKKVSSFFYLFHSLHFIFENVCLSSFKDYAIFHKFEDCAIKADRLILDIFSFYRDIDKGSIYDNYVLIIQSEYNCSVEDALNITVKLFNKQVIKMYSLKKVMQWDPIYENNQELQKAIVIIENNLQGAIDWCLQTKRYQSKSTISISRKKLTEVNLPLILQFFENKAKDTSCQNLKLGNLA